MDQIFLSGYTIVSPVRNEEEYIEKTIISVVNQTIKPIEYIIVNDGSTDKTPQIIKKYTDKYSWIKCYERPKGKHSPGPGVVKAFYAGFENIKNDTWNFIVKLDADLSFEKDYFEFQLKEFALNPKLGMTSGVTYMPNGNGLVMDKMPEDHVRGAAKMYRRECFEQIGGLQQVLGWDTIDELSAQHSGWTTRSYRNLVLIHYKPIGIKQTNLIKRELLAGDRQYYLGYHPMFAIGKNLYRMMQRPFFVAGFLNLIGFFKSCFQRKERIEPELIKHLRKKQVQRMTLKTKLW
jgi:glycosyltransferase involved in cell wall biosynthesis